MLERNVNYNVRNDAGHILLKLAPIETHPLKLSSIEKPTISGRTELLLEIEACGICRSNLHRIEGDWKKYSLPSTCHQY